MHKELPQIIYPDDYDPQNDGDVEESKMRGYLSHVRVKIDDDNEYPVYFSDLVRLNQDMARWVEQGNPCFAPVGLIIVDEVIPELMEKAVLYLWKMSYFTFFASVKDRSYDVMY